MRDKDGREMVETEREKLNRNQKIIIAGRIIRFALRIFVIIGVISIAMLLVPYVNGEKEFEELPLTLSQLEALIFMCGLLYMLRKSRI